MPKRKSASESKKSSEKSVASKRKTNTATKAEIVEEVVDDVFIIRAITGKRIYLSRVEYQIEWDVPGTNRQWKQFTELIGNLPLIIQFEKDHPGEEKKMMEKAKGKKASKNFGILPSWVKYYRNEVKENDFIQRVVAFDPLVRVAIIWWESGYLTRVDLRNEDIKDVLKSAIIQTIEAESRYVIEQMTGVLPPEKDLVEEEELPDGTYIDRHSVSHFALKSVMWRWERWSKVNKEADSSVVAPFYIAPTFPYREETRAATVNLTMCATCGTVYEEPGISFLAHLLGVNHLGWYGGVELPDDEAELQQA